MIVKLTDEQLYAKHPSHGRNCNDLDIETNWLNRRKTGEFNEDELKGMKAVDKYKQETGRKFVSVVEMIYIIRHAELW